MSLAFKKLKSNLKFCKSRSEVGTLGNAAFIKEDEVAAFFFFFLSYTSKHFKNHIDAQNIKIVIYNSFY